MSTEIPVTTPPATPAAEDRTVAILSYITLIGFIVAIIIHSSKKTDLGSFHLRQALGLIVSGIGFGICAIILAFIPFLGWALIMAGWIAMIVFVIMGFIAACTGQKKPVPLIGEHYQKWFANAFT
jgi:uncharacterized membrane protein